MSHENVANATHVGRNVPNEVAHPLILERLRRRVVVTASGCWEWQGPINRKGYGWATYKGRNEHVHRVMYRVTKGAGEIPAGLHICHTCDNGRCINPDHLYAGTPMQNERDKVDRRRHHHTRKTHCAYGHEFTDENTLVVKGKHGKPWRHCKTCQRIRLRIKAGWPRELAETHPPVPHGYRVNT